MTPARTYRFGFVLSTGGGNLTRYLNLRKYAERDPEIACLWAPLAGHVSPDPFPRLPPVLHRRLLSMHAAAPVLRHLSTLDAIMFHAFEPYVYAAARSLVSQRPALVWSQDDAPTSDPHFWDDYGLSGRSAWRARARYTVDAWCARRTKLLLPFSHWAADALIAESHVSRERVHAIPVGIDLELWPCARPRNDEADRRPILLFVGSAFTRKGGHLLVDVFRERLSARADLHLVTGERPNRLPANAFVHQGLAPNDPRLRELFAQSDLLVLPTRADLSPNVVLEAMATGIPVIATRVGAIAEMVRDGETGFLIRPNDGVALAESIETLLSDPQRRQQMGMQARRIAEREFSAGMNVPRILALMKQAADGISPGRPLEKAGDPLRPKDHNRDGSKSHDDDVTIVSVVYDNAALLLQNVAFVDRFNGGDLPRWIVVDNSPQPLSWPELPQALQIIAGVPKVQGRDAGSLHHALGLEAGLKQVRTRYVLLLDSDFYVLRHDWIATLSRHMRERRLAIFGSVWHPRWYYQYRYFPSVHFMLIDTQQVPLDAVDLKPRIHSDRWWRLINNDELPVPFRRTLKATRIRDTGWQLYCQYRRKSAIAYECLIPHFVPDAGRRYRLERALRPLLPESVCVYPKDEDRHTAQTFLRDDFPDAYAAGWEEFYWQGAPFAFHLRQVGRRMQKQSTQADLAGVVRALAWYRRESPG